MHYCNLAVFGAAPLIPTNSNQRLMGLGEVPATSRVGPDGICVDDGAAPERRT